MKCNIIAQRVHLQEHLARNFEEIEKEVDGFLNNDEEAKTLDRQKVEDVIFEGWLRDFTLY